MEMQLQLRPEQVCSEAARSRGQNTSSHMFVCAADKDKAKRPMINEITTGKTTASLMLNNATRL